MKREQPLSVLKLTELARLYPAGALPPAMHQSYPVPVPGPKGLHLAFLYGRAEIVKPREGLQLWPPSYVAYLNALTGKFEELRAATPKDFGQWHAEDKPLGPYLTLSERLEAEFLTKQVRWYQAYDVLLPLFAAGLPKPPADAREAVAEFRALFPQVTEAPLVPYYKALAPAFFSWLDAIPLDTSGP